MAKKTETQKTDLQPRKKSVLIQRIHENAQTKGGLVIADSSLELRPVGRIIAVGSECDEDLKNSIGKKVVFNKYANLEVTDSYGNTFLMVFDTDVYCFINDNTIVLDNESKKYKRIDIKKN
jgi:co-chaperonin GroES (HSP10)